MCYNNLTISNCFNEEFYLKDWDKSKKKCPSNHKEMCREFNCKNKDVPFGWFPGETNEKYYCIGTRHARSEFSSDKYFEMKEHIINQRRYFFLQHIKKCYEFIKNLNDVVEESPRDNLKFMYYLETKIRDVYNEMKICLGSIIEDKKLPFDTYRHIDYIYKNNKINLEEYFFYEYLKHKRFTYNVYTNNYNFNKGMDYIDNNKFYIQNKCHVLGFIIRDLEKMYKDVKLCNENLCYCIFELDKDKLFLNKNYEKFKLNFNSLKRYKYCKE